MSKDAPVMAMCAIALTFLAVSYIKGTNMRIHLTFADQDNKTHHVEGEWPSVADAVDWARKLFKASTVIPFRI